MSSLYEDIKVKLFKAWLPDKPGGLDGLVRLAAQAAAEVVEQGCGHAEELEQLGRRVEDLTESLHFAEASLVKEDGEGQYVDDDSHDDQVGLTQYACTECNVTHKADSRVGGEHLAQYLREQVIANVEPVE